MGKKRSLADQIDLDTQRASEMVGWCGRIALHQEFGVGKQRWEAVENRLMAVSDYCLDICMEGEVDGKSPGQRSREARLALLPEGTPTELRIPLRRAPKNRREQQLKMAQDKAATLTWQGLAAACHQELGFAGVRLTRLHGFILDNIRQLDTWCAEEGPEVALEWLRRCAEAACAETVGIDNRSEEEVLREQHSSWDEQVDRFERRAILREVGRRTAKTPAAPAPQMPQDMAEKFAACRSLAEGQAYRRRR